MSGGLFRKLAASGHGALYRTALGVRDQAHLATTPIDRRHDDTYLVEFPKSGITWLTFLLGSINLQNSGIDRVPTFFAVNDSIPDIHTSRHLGPPLPWPGHRMIKSHAEHNPLYTKVIYLVRDPRDVMTSYHAFLSKLGWYDGSLEAMVADPRFGVDAWCRHVEGWLTKTKADISFNVIRYEDLRQDAAAVVTDIYRVLGFTVDAAVLARALEIGDFKAMKEDEQICNRRNLARPEGFSFVRKGGSAGRQELSDSLRQRILDQAGPWMERLGYSTTAD